MTAPTVPAGPPDHRPTAPRLLERVVGPLFPDESPDSAVRPVWVVLGALVAGAVFALRLPWAKWDALWAEDGSQFLQTALDDVWWRTLFEPYAGYFHLVPRLAAEAAAQVPLRWVPYALALAAAGIVGVTAATVWRFSASHLRSPTARLLLAAGVALVPAGALEAVGNVANSHFFLTFATFWVLLGRPRTRPAAVVGPIVVALAVLSDPLTLVLAPLAVARLLVARGRRDLAVPLTYLIAGVVQLGGIAGATRETGDPSAVSAIVVGFGYRVGASAALGVRLAGDLLSATGVVSVTALGLGVLGLTLLAALARRRHRWATGAAVVLCVTYFVVPSVFTLAGGVFPPVGDATYDLTVGGRYTIVPTLLLLSALLLAVDRPPTPGARRRPPLAVLAMVPLTLWAVTGYSAPAPFRALVQPWSVSVQQLQTTCATAPPGTPVALPVEPGGPVWVVVVRCPPAAGG